MKEGWIITAAELAAMTPDERAWVFSERVVTDLSTLDPEFAARIRAKGRGAPRSQRCAEALRVGVPDRWVVRVTDALFIQLDEQRGSDRGVNSKGTRGADRQAGAALAEQALWGADARRSRKVNRDYSDVCGSAPICTESEGVGVESTKGTEGADICASY